MIINTKKGGGGTTITDGIVIKSTNANGYPTEVDFYGTVIPPRCFGFPTTNATPFGRYLETINCINAIQTIKNGAFSMCTALEALPNAFLSATTIEESAFWGCSNLTGSYVFPNITTLEKTIFRGCNINELSFPKATILRPTSGYGTKLTVGSVGYGVTSMNYDWLYYNSSLTDLTVFCVGGKVDSYLTDCRRYGGGVTATIVFKASEATTYGGTSYAAGDTMLTSTPT